MSAQKDDTLFPKSNPFDPLNITSSYAAFWEDVIQHPEKFWETQLNYFEKFLELSAESQKKMLGDEKAYSVITPDAGDRRFKSKEWEENAFFDFIKQAYLLSSNLMEEHVNSAKNMNPREREKLLFSTRLMTSAMSPTNFAMTNPDVIRETMESGGENIIKGLDNLREDIERGGGTLKIRTVDDKAFEIGKDIATTEGSVIFENELMQLIHHKPLTEKQFETPLLIVPPWINKYYILDLKPENSLIKYALEQGQNVFVISWVNPDASLAHVDFEDYISEGIFKALENIEKVTSEKSCNAVGYCIGGTLLTCALSVLKSMGKQDKINSATFFTTLIDFEDAGELKIFLGEEQLEALETLMREEGVFSAKQLQQTFSLLRANDLIWSFVVNNYLMGKEPFPFDLLYWNDDSTNLPAKMQSTYLRAMYRDNLLSKPGAFEVLGHKVDVSKIDTPCYFISAREDHIAPWMSTYEGAKMMHKGGNKKVNFTLSASGHIAGIINPPHKNKYCYWVNDMAETAEDWMDGAKQHEGSWWPHWAKWIAKQSGDKVKASNPKGEIEPAPGRYVKRRA